jgi:hypothetical protein
MEEQIRVQTRLQLNRAGERYEVLLIQAGETQPTRGYPNGLRLPEAVLKASLPLWEEVQSFVDHRLEAHSVRDLCGVIRSPAWDEANRGIRAVFTPFGPAAEVARSVANDVLEHPELAGQVGFSADFLFEAGRDQREAAPEIAAIVSVHSADLVIQPAAGGRWLRAINQIHSIKENQMEEIREQTEENSEQEESVQMAGQMREALLGASLAASRLPDAWQERIRADFHGQSFEAGALQERIEADRRLLSETTAARTVQGPAVHGMVSADEQLQAAVYDLFGLERDPALRQVQAARLSGIRELYLLLTGDYDLHSGLSRGRAQFQLGTTNFTVLVKNALNKSLARHWDSFGKAGYDWWTNIATIEHFTSLNDITWSIFGTVGSLPTVAEGAEYTPLKIGDGGETSSFVKKGGYIGLTLEAIDRDDLGALKRLPKELAFAAIREISASVAALFTANAGVGPTLADTGALFNNTAVTTAGGHKNLLTTALGTDYTAWEAVAQAMYNQPMLIANETGYIGTGKAMAIEPKYCLVPRALRGAANSLFVARQVNYGIDNMYYGQVFPVTVPEWTDATDWAAVADPHLVPGVMIGERFGLMPEIFIAGNETDPAVFMNDESRIKVRHFTAVGVCDFRPLHKSNMNG